MCDASNQTMKELAKPIIRLAVVLAAGVVFLFLMGRYANPFVDDVAPIEDLQSALRPPPGPTTTVVPPPTGFPSMEFPPSKIEVPDGQPQPIATKFGLTYTVPSDWRNGWGSIVSWSNPDGVIATYGTTSDFGYRYCPETDGSTLAEAGATGRNGVDLDSAAHAEVLKAEQIFSDKSGNMPKVEIRGPFSMQISDRPAVRYTALLSDIPKENSCDPETAQFDIVATPGYATAEVMVFMVERFVGIPGSPTGDVIDGIISSLRKS